MNKAYKIIHSNSLYVLFTSGPSTEGYRGFLLTYSPYGKPTTDHFRKEKKEIFFLFLTGNDTLPPITTESPITIPPSEVQVYEVQLVLPEESKTNVTWHKFKEVLAGSASKYVTDENLNFEQAQYVPLNVPLLLHNF